MRIDSSKILEHLIYALAYCATPGSAANSVVIITRVVLYISGRFFLVGAVAKRLVHILSVIEDWEFSNLELNLVPAPSLHTHS